MFARLASKKHKHTSKALPKGRVKARASSPVRGSSGTQADGRPLACSHSPLIRAANDRRSAAPSARGTKSAAGAGVKPQWYDPAADKAQHTLKGQREIARRHQSTRVGRVKKAKPVSSAPSGTGLFASLSSATAVSIAEESWKGDDLLPPKRKRKKHKRQTDGGRCAKRQRREPVRRPCEYHLRGMCNQGAACLFAHDGEPGTTDEYCKFFILGRCRNGEKCPFSHNIPCVYYHLKGQCQNGSLCRFGHDRLTTEQRSLLEAEEAKRLKSAVLLTSETPHPPLHTTTDADVSALDALDNDKEGAAWIPFVTPQERPPASSKPPLPGLRSWSAPAWASKPAQSSKQNLSDKHVQANALSNMSKQTSPDKRVQAKAL